MRGRSKRHHFTPRYYLKNFQDDDGKLWRRDTKSGKIVCGDHNSFGLKKHWNTLRKAPVGYDPDWAEKKIGDIDHHASKSLGRLLAGDFKADLRPLAVAMSLMEHHQPKLRDSIKQNHAERTSSWSDDWFLIVGLKTALANWEIYHPESFVILQIDRRNDLRFLTSSNPVISFENKPTMMFPLSAKCCLLMSHEPNAGFGAPRFVSCDDGQVAGINSLVCQNSWQYLYSCNDHFRVGL